MSYTALYRKYRPQTFEGVIGQDHIIKTLKNQILSNRVSHAYLFCGTRGTGKTSTAKIFARALNCLSPDNAEPCNECEMCKSNTMNVIEIDAASNNGVDNIREIREEVKYPPTEGKYKVYIIDEVHMLSIGAFNALLKTLEEPPEHVVFILATTDPQKVPATILSRCQRFDFRRISTEEIVNTMKKYIQEESVQVEDKALKYIATLGDGSMRDSLSILDQCLAFYYNEVVTLDKVMDVIGSVDNSVFFDCINAIVEKDAKNVLSIVDDVVMQGRDIIQFVTELIQHLRNLLIVITIGQPEKVLDLSEDNINKYKEQSKSISANETMYYIKQFSELLSDLRYANNARIILEVCLLKLCTPQADNSVESVIARLESIERDIKLGNFKVSSTVSGTKPIDKIKTKPKAIPKAMSEDVKTVKNVWNEIITGFDAILRSFLQKTTVGTMDSEGIVLICETEIISEKIKKELSSIKEAIENKVEKSFQISVVSKTEYDTWYQAKFGGQDDDFSEFEGIENILPDIEFEE